MKTKSPTRLRTRGAKSKAVSLQRIAEPPAGRVIELVPSVLRIRRILVPLDFSAPAEKALRYAVSFARQFDAKITLLHVCPLPYYVGEVGGFPAIMPDAELPGKMVQAHLDDAAARLIPPEMRGRTRLRVGVAFDEICKVARQSKANLIIIATHGHTGLKHIVLGSTAERVVRHAPCPVLVVREKEREFA